MTRIKYLGRLIVGWWRLTHYRCPSCGNIPVSQHYIWSCKVCYEWAARPENKGTMPSPELVGNWKSRWKNEEQV